VLISGEAGVGKTRLLLEAQREAGRRGILALRGRAVESGGAYRPLVDAFARASAPFANDPVLARLRPTLRGCCPVGLPTSGSGDQATRQVCTDRASSSAIASAATEAPFWCRISAPRREAASRYRSSPRTCSMA
jgi:hypothetical protein